MAYIQAIRSAQRFIYVENHYFIGSSYAWSSDQNSGANNLVPIELALKIASKILWRFKKSFIGRAEGTSSVDDFTLAAEASLPLICAMLAEIRNKTYHLNYFLNVDIPTDVMNHKGYRLTSQSKSTIKTGWVQVTSEAQGGKMLSILTMDADSSSNYETESLNAKHEHLQFKREVRGSHMDDDDIDSCSLKKGYVCPIYCCLIYPIYGFIKFLF